MAQLNIHVRPDFEEDLARLMRLRKIPTKSQAIRLAVHEGVERAAQARSGPTDFRRWSGWALRAKVNQQPRFSNDDDLWD